MVAWTYVTYGVAGSDYDVLGQRVAPYGVYLPLVLRE
jgi:hypothetical protein